MSVEVEASLFEEIPVDQKEKQVAVFAEDLEMKERETKDDQYTLLPVKESSLVSQGIFCLSSFLYSEF